MPSTITMSTGVNAAAWNQRSDFQNQERVKSETSPAAESGPVATRTSSEAARALRDWAYATQGWTTLVSHVHPENARSIRLAERLGARLDPSAPHPEDDPCIVYRHPGPEGRA